MKNNNEVYTILIKSTQPSAAVETILNRFYLVHLKAKPPFIAPSPYQFPAYSLQNAYEQQL